MFTTDAQQQAFSFLVQQASYIEPQVYDILYPDVNYAELIPVDPNANEWASMIEFFSMDKVGQAEWFHAEADDMPRADTKMEKFIHRIEMAGIGYGYNLQELNAARLTNTNLTTDRAQAAVRAYEEFMYTLALSGDTERNLTGLFNDANVTVTSADNTGTTPTGSTNFSDKTGDNVSKDINDALSGVHTGSETVEMADTVLLPTAVFNDIASRRNSDSSDVTILEYVRKNNVYTAHTGQELMIRANRRLDDAGAGGVGRMVVYRRDPMVLKLHLPMPHRFLPVWQTGPMKFDVPGIFRTGGVEIRRPGAVRYVDGVSGDST